MRSLALTLLLALMGCSDVTNPQGTNPEEVITTVNLTLTPQSGGSASTFGWTDPENDGSPVIDEVVLTVGESYGLAVSFLNELASPTEDITVEVEAEGYVHQVFFLGAALEDGLVTHAYADSDDNGDPIGLDNELDAVAEGSGALRVVLRHMPGQGEASLKTSGLAEVAATDGVDALPGDSDVDVEFPLTVAM